MLGLEFQVASPQVEEPPPAPGQDGGEYARSMALLKGREAARARRDAIIIAADTVVVLEGRILGKPATVEEAESMLNSLCGREHTVFTGCYVALEEEGIEEVLLVESRVRLRAASREEISAYVATGEPMDKAGAYGVQGIGGCLVEQVHGSCTNVVGLPLSHLVERMVRLGLLEVVEP